MKHGEVSEWLKELVLKTSDPERDRGFKSHLLRFSRPPKGGFVIARRYITSSALFGEVPKLAEGARLESE